MSGTRRKSSAATKRRTEAGPRLAKVGIAGDLLLEFFTTGHGWSAARCVEGLPADAQIRGATWDGRVVWLIVEHASLPPVVDGQEIPYRDVALETSD